jgi:hypothetical protein
MNRHLLAVAVASFLLIPLVTAQSYCYDANTVAYNKTYNVSGVMTDFGVFENCPLGCDTTRGICHEPMGTPIEIYMFFEIVAFVSLAGSFWSAKKAEDVMLIFPIIACMLFFILGYLGGTLIIGGEFVISMLSIWMNYALAMMCMILIFYNLLTEFGRQNNERRQQRTKTEI